MKRDFLKYIYRVATLSLLLLVSCLKNDIPYPVIELEIIKVEGVGFTQKSTDSRNGVVTLSLDETTDIRAVQITDVTYTEDAELSNPVVGIYDMRYPLTTTLSLYQDYNWSIEAEQTITRDFKVTGQIGDARIDTTQKTVEVDVNQETVDISKVEVLEMKLAAADITTYSPTLESLTNTSFATVRQVQVTSHDRTNTWRISVIPIEASVVLTVDTWGTVAWLSATGDTSDPDLCRFVYRMAGATDWTSVAATSASGGVFSAKVTGLLPSIEYEFDAYVGDVNSGGQSSVTESTPQLTNSGFEGWQMIGNAWYPYAEGDSEFWGTGNKGATILSSNSNITLPDSNEKAPGTTGTYSTWMTSSAVVGVFAAGNIFTGRFVEIAGTNGIIGFGRPFTERPLALRGWAKYTPGTVTHSTTDMLSVGDMDMGSIYIALGTWDAATYGKDADGDLLGDSTTPIIIDTRDKNTFFDSTTSDVIAYGELILTEDQDWSEFEIELEYRDLVNSSGQVIESASSRVPTHILIVCSSSRYGDYFTGSTKSNMWIDDFELLYE